MHPDYIAYPRYARDHDMAALTRQQQAVCNNQGELLQLQAECAHILQGQLSEARDLLDYALSPWQKQRQVQPGVHAVRQSRWVVRAAVIALQSAHDNITVSLAAAKRYWRVV